MGEERINETTPETGAGSHDAGVDADFRRSVALHEQGQLKQAATLLRQLLICEPDHAGALGRLGLICLQAGDPVAAIDVLDRLIALCPQEAQARLHRGHAMAALGAWEAALVGYADALKVDPHLHEALVARGIALFQLRRLDEALSVFEPMAALNPEMFEAHVYCANTLLEIGRLEDAVTAFEAALNLNPGVFEASFNCGNALMRLQRPSEALARFDDAIRLRPDHANAHNNRAGALLALKRPQEALASLDEALQLKPDLVSALNNRGSAFLELERPFDALASFEEAVVLDPDQCQLHLNLGHCLRQLGRPGEALSCIERAIRLSPDRGEAHCARANALMELGRTHEALRSCETALLLKPALAEAHYVRGILLLHFERGAEALACFERALTLQADYAEAIRGQGLVALSQKRSDEARVYFDRALALKPDMPLLLGYALHARMQACDWSGFDDILFELEMGIRAQKLVTEPFATLSLIDAPEVQKLSAQTYTRRFFASTPSLGEFGARNSQGKIRLGFFSSDFRLHPMSQLIASLIEMLDRSKFEVFGFSFGPDDQSAARQRMSAAFDRFEDVRHLSDKEVALLARDFRIDIAIDLNGHTQHARTRIFAYRCAPIQVSYLGFPGTMGAEFIDYILADSTVIPEEYRSNYTEKVVYLPDTYYPTDPAIPLSRMPLTRADHNLPAHGFVFCCFNSSYKILPQTFELWMRLLGRVEGSVLWLRKESEVAADNIRRHASLSGIHEDRLIFAAPLPLADHLARHQLADLFVDTFPYNAHTTATDALMAGLPLVTYAGRSFASRVGASLLKAVGLPQLIAETQAEYEDKVFSLAQDREGLAKIRFSLAAGLKAAPLFDTARMARNIGAAFERMIAIHQAGEAPRDYHV